MIDLWTFYFEVMQEYLDGLLDILVACICQGTSTGLWSILWQRMLTIRKRHPRTYRYFMFPTTPRVERTQIITCEMGEYRFCFRTALYDDYRLSAVRP